MKRAKSLSYNQELVDFSSLALDISVGKMKFVADGMLGKLTRWLRLAGQDVVCINDFTVSSGEEDEVLLELAASDSRVLITKDVELHQRALKNSLESILLREEGEVAHQMDEISEKVGKSFDISPKSSRCPVCNGELESVEKDSVKEDIHEKVLDNNEKFWKCEKCGKIYWLGGHWEKIGETMEKMED